MQLTGQLPLTAEILLPQEISLQVCILDPGIRTHLRLMAILIPVVLVLMDCIY